MKHNLHPVDMPNAARFQEGLHRALDVALADEIMRRVQERYRVLYAQRKHYPQRELRKHLEENILPGVALYQILLEYPDTQGQALALVEVAFQEWGAAMRRTMARLGRLPFFYGLLRVLIRPVMRSSFPSQGWDVEWVEVSGQQIAFNMRSCFYLDVLDEYDMLELVAPYCMLDELIYQDVSPYVQWARKYTLGRGDAYCDFCFYNARSPD